MFVIEMNFRGLISEVSPVSAVLTGNLALEQWKAESFLKKTSI
jgi:hypothetical protein